MEKIRCIKCLENKPSSAFGLYRRHSKIRQPCKACVSAEWRMRHNRQKKDPAYLERLAIADRKHRLSTRLKVLALYGNMCACCAENRYEFLGIDHIKGGGKKHRASFAGYPAFLRWLLEKKREGFRVLCHNCNLSLGFYRYCPHESSLVKSVNGEKR